MQPISSFSKLEISHLPGYHKYQLRIAVIKLSIAIHIVTSTMKTWISTGNVAPFIPTHGLSSHTTDKHVLSLKWNNHIAIRKHNRNILLHI